MANKYNTVFYTGVTSDLVKRTWLHKKKIVHGFTKKYNITKLVYYEIYENIQKAIEREKYIKGKKRRFKLDLIEKNNPQYKDLYKELM